MLETSKPYDEVPNVQNGSNSKASLSDALEPRRGPKYLADKNCIWDEFDQLNLRFA